MFAHAHRHLPYIQRPHTRCLSHTDPFTHTHGSTHTRGFFHTYLFFHTRGDTHAVFLSLHMWVSEGGTEPSRCVFTSVAKCVLQRTHSVGARACVRATPCVSETPRVSVIACVSERVCVRETACVRSLYVREMTVGMREHAAASPRVSVMEWCVSLLTRSCAWFEWRRRRRQMRDKGRVAAVAVMGTAPGLHGGEREVRAVQRTRLPRARLRE